VCRRHASHITVVLSKAAHSGPSVCLRARAPCPLRVSCPGTDRAERAVQAAGVSVQPSCRRERAVQTAGSCASVPPLVKTGYEPCAQFTHGPGLRSLVVPRKSPLCGPCRSLRLRAKHGGGLTSTSLRTVQTHLCVCTKHCGVSRRVRPVSFVDDVALSLTLPYFPGSFLSRTPRVKHVKQRQDNRP
jgi:hypothetical protein